MALTCEMGRRIRVFCDDPHATDVSSDEEEGVSRRRACKKKKMVVEICIPSTPLACPSTPNASSSKKGFPKEASKGAKTRGVRQRKWGKWAAEIRDPIRQIRLWLGTFDTREEAAFAYQREAMRLEAEKNAMTVSSSASSSNSDAHNLPAASVSSPSSVLDLANSVIPTKENTAEEFPILPESEIEDVMVPFDMDFGFDVSSFFAGDELGVTSNTFAAFEDLSPFCGLEERNGMMGPFCDRLEDIFDFDADPIASMNF